MEIKLLKETYNKEKLYQDFIHDEIDLKGDYVSEEKVFIEKAPDFPIYLAKEHHSLNDFSEAILTLKKYYIQTDRDLHFNKRFWHSLFTLYKREYLVNKYPEIVTSQRIFENIVVKKFDWENYVYKCVLAAEYMQDSGFSERDVELKFIKTIYENLDMYNYLIKYNIFRNRQFIIKFLEIIEEENLSNKLKKKIQNRPDLGKDERYGRRVIFELNKNYPVLMAPFLEKEELKEEINRALALYSTDDL